MTTVIIGAGLAGLVAGKILADRKPLLIEKQEKLPHNHKAVLRFRSDLVSQATGIPFRKVRVLKAICGSLGNSVADAMAYSYKVTGQYTPRSILSLEPVDRYVAPGDFIKRLAAAQHNIAFGKDGVAFVRGSRSPVISTMPMPVLMNAFGYDGPRPSAWGERRGWTITGRIPSELVCDLFCTIYFPSADHPMYRASITGRDVMIEGMMPEDEHSLPTDKERDRIAGDALRAMGIYCSYHGEWRRWGWESHEAKYQKLGQLTTVDRERAKAFIMWATREHNVYSLGRFATWRPGLLLDDVVQDVQIVRKLIEGGSDYEWRK